MGKGEKNARKMSRIQLISLFWNVLSKEERLLLIQELQGLEGN